MSPRDLWDEAHVKLGIQGILAIALVACSFALAAVDNANLNGFLGLTGFAVAWAYKNGNGHATK